MSDAEVVPEGVDPTQLSPARLYDYLLGGTRNAIPEHPELRRLIDFSQPVGVLMTAVLQFVADGSDPWSLVRRYMTATAPGSYLALSHVTHDRLPAQITEVALEVYQRTPSNIYARTHDEVARFFDGLELVPAQPGGERAITFTGLWGAEDPATADSDGSRAFYCGVARRP
jgi:S-adenosyl methyltransferase